MTKEIKSVFIQVNLKVSFIGITFYFFSGMNEYNLSFVKKTTTFFS